MIAKHPSPAATSTWIPSRAHNKRDIVSKIICTRRLQTSNEGRNAASINAKCAHIMRQHCTKRIRRLEWNFAISGLIPITHDYPIVCYCLAPYCWLLSHHSSITVGYHPIIIPLSAHYHPSIPGYHPRMLTVPSSSQCPIFESRHLWPSSQARKNHHQEHLEPSPTSGSSGSKVASDSSETSPDTVRALRGRSWAEPKGRREEPGSPRGPRWSQGSS